MNSQKTYNILTILTDQQRFDSLSCMGNPIVHTPNLDRLAKEGALFTNAVCSTPLCGPSRASLLSGMFYHGHRFMRNVEINRSGMAEEIDTVDEILNSNGYHVEYHGKWHTGKENRGCYYGGLEHFSKLYKEYFDEKYPFEGIREDQRIDRYTKTPYCFIELDDIILNTAKQGLEMPHHNEAGEIEVKTEDTLTAWTAQRVINFIKNCPPQPFAVTCSILHPHAPLVAAKPYFNMYDPVKMPMPQNVEDDCEVIRPKGVPNGLPLTPEGLGTYMAIYYGLIKEIDDWIGKLIYQLEQSGLRDNTLIIFTSDHGDLMGSHGTVSKMKMFEEAIRVPLIMSLPGVIPMGQKVDFPATGADIMPTILDFAAISIPPNVHGESLKPLLTGKGAIEREYAYSEFKDEKMIRSKDWKLVLNPSKLSNLNERCMLYNLKNDPGEQHNLLSAAKRNAENIAVAEKLKTELVKIMERMQVPNKTIDIYRKFIF